MQTLQLICYCGWRHWGWAWITRPLKQVLPMLLALLIIPCSALASADLLAGDCPRFPGDSALVLPFHILTGKCDPFPSPSHTWTSIPTAHIPGYSICPVLGNSWAQSDGEPFHPADTGWTVVLLGQLMLSSKPWNKAGPYGAPGHLCFLSWVPKGRFKQVAYQRREGIQKQGRSSQETIAQPWGQSPGSLKGVGGEGGGRGDRDGEHM